VPVAHLHTITSESKGGAYDAIGTVFEDVGHGEQRSMARFVEKANMQSAEPVGCLQVLRGT